MRRILDDGHIPRANICVHQYLYRFLHHKRQRSRVDLYMGAAIQCSCTRMNGAATQCSAGEKQTPSLLFQLQVQRDEQFAFDSWTRKNMEIRYFLQCTAASTFDLDLDSFDRRSVGSTDQGIKSKSVFDNLFPNTRTALRLGFEDIMSRTRV
jgi:hypothetical protein